MRNVFNYDGPFISAMTRVADLFWLNILYVICCIPIVTIGAANTALYYVTLKMTKDEDSGITKLFFKSFIQNLRQATVIWVIFLGIIIILFSDLYIAAGRNLTGLMNFDGVNDVVLVAVGVMAIVVTFILQYIFAILAQFDNSIFNTIKNAFLISVRHLPYTVLFIVVFLLPHVIIYFSIMRGNGMAILLVLFMFSLVAYIKSKSFAKIFKLYMPKEEESLEESEEKIFTDHQ